MLALSSTDAPPLAAYQDPNLYKAIGPGGILLDPPDWWSNPDYSDRIIHVVHHCPDATNMRTVVAQSKQRGAGNVYVVNTIVGKNKREHSYDHLPPYWPELVQAAGDAPKAAAGKK